METEETAVVKNLKKQVEDDLQAACEANGDLKELMKFLEGNVEETEPETESSEEETETEGGSDESESAESLEGSEEGSGTGGGSEDGESNSMEETEPPEEDRHN
jgi:hypothetical protein